MKKVGVASMACALSAMLVAGCGTNSNNANTTTGASKANTSGSKSITLTMWTYQLEKFKPYIDSVISQFEKAHPGVTVNWVDVPATGFDQKLIAAYQGNNSPDLINEFTPVQQLYKYYAPLNNDLTKAQIASFFPAAVQTMTVNGNLYAFPFYGTTPLPSLPMYNMALLKKAGITTLPTTVQQNLQDAIKFHKADPMAYWSLSPIQPQSEATTYGSSSACLELYDFGVPLLTPNFKKAGFDTPEGVKVLTMYANAYKQGAFDPDTGSSADPTNLFVQGAIATYGSGLISDLQNSWGPILNDIKVGPPITGPYSATHEQVGSGWYWAVSAQSKHPKLAAQLGMQFLTVSNQLAFYKATSGDVGANTEQALNNPGFEQGITNPVAKSYTNLQHKYYDPNKKVVTSPTLQGQTTDFPNQTQVVQALNQYWDDAIEGEMSPSAALQQAAQAVNNILSNPQNGSN
ncbi:extracellular solute-binding protein [Alicyclobacillus fastidiosus]|uniref:Extracellular solute-binding protein n=1 Tax=Alicyclobacillus fastidiosus TaxID=392011 RepID=A0ABY6ZPF9_9BACL|nr:extracellular solute-binding protein [Alicyclobacillus fastidiosus]WAH44727.1 extracellular solute-binding protein [Alicyclobacillus fastidiosus]